MDLFCSNLQDLKDWTQKLTLHFFICIEFMFVLCNVASNNSLLKNKTALFNPQTTLTKTVQFEETGSSSTQRLWRDGMEECVERQGKMRTKRLGAVEGLEWQKNWEEEKLTIDQGTFWFDPQMDKFQLVVQRFGAKVDLSNEINTGRVYVYWGICKNAKLSNLKLTLVVLREAMCYCPE